MIIIIIIIIIIMNKSQELTVFHGRQKLTSGPVSVGIPEAVPAGFSGPVTMQVPTIMLNDGIGKCNVLK